MVGLQLLIFVIIDESVFSCFCLQNVRKLPRSKSDMLKCLVLSNQQSPEPKDAQFTIMWNRNNFTFCLPVPPSQPHFHFPRALHCQVHQMPSDLSTCPSHLTPTSTCSQVFRLCLISPVVNNRPISAHCLPDCQCFLCLCFAAIWTHTLIYIWGPYDE